MDSLSGKYFRGCHLGAFSYAAFVIFFSPLGLFFKCIYVLGHNWPEIHHKKQAVAMSMDRKRKMTSEHSPEVKDTPEQTKRNYIFSIQK